MVADPGAWLKCGIALTRMSQRPSLCCVGTAQHVGQGSATSPMHATSQRATANRRLRRRFVSGLLTLSLAGVNLRASSPSSAQDATAANPGHPRTAQGSPIQLPDGPAARAFASSPKTGATVAFGGGICPPDIDGSLVPPDAWRNANTWVAWSAAWELESLHENRDIQQRAFLALLALAQTRWDDAWMHFDACDGSREWMSALLPSFLPGVPRGTKFGAGVLPPPLRDGGVLRPSLPPPSDRAAPGRIDVRAMKVDGFVVGAATLSMRVAVEAEGVQIEIEHRSGGAARLSIVIPESSQFEIENEYVDWMVQETHHQPLALEIKPGDEAHTIYGRFQARALTHPTRVTERAPAQLEEGAVRLLVPDDPAEKPYFDTIAASLKRLPLKIDFVVVTSASDSKRPPESGPQPSGITVDLRSASERDDKLAWLVSSLEHFLLARDRSEPR
jgi:hypothetical protein